MIGYRSMRLWQPEHVSAPQAGVKFAVDRLFAGRSVSLADVEPIAPAPTADEVVDVLRREPFENGAPHSLDDWFRSAIASDSRQLQATLRCVWDRLPVRRPDLLLLVARLPEYRAESPFTDLVRAGLASERPAERSAAIRVLEAWRTPSARAILEAHDEPVERLADYQRRVLESMRR